MPLIEHKDKQVHYLLAGTGPKKVVLLHGFLGDLSIWDRYTSDLDERYTVLRIDLAGHGLSDNISEVHTMEVMAEPVITVMNFIGMRSAHFVGHSMGGYVAMAIAEMEKSLVLSLCLLNSTPVEDSELKKRDRIRTIRLIDLSPELFVNEAINNLFTVENLEQYSEDVQKLKELGLKSALKGAAPALRGMAKRQDMCSFLRRNEFPVLFLSGKHDNIIPIQSVIEKADATGSQIEILEKTNHMGFIEEYDLTLGLLQSFWESN